MLKFVILVRFMYLPQTTTLKNDSICVQFCTHGSYKTCIEQSMKIVTVSVHWNGIGWLLTRLLSSPNIIALSVV